MINDHYIHRLFWHPLLLGWLQYRCGTNDMATMTHNMEVIVQVEEITRENIVGTVSRAVITLNSIIQAFDEAGYRIVLRQNVDDDGISATIYWIEGEYMEEIDLDCHRPVKLNV